MIIDATECPAAVYAPLIRRDVLHRRGETRIRDRAAFVFIDIP
jgi:hypothetical protein